MQIRRENFAPPPTPTTHPHVKQDREFVTSRKFSVYLNGVKEVDGAISELSPIELFLSRKAV